MFSRRFQLARLLPDRLVAVDDERRAEALGELSRRNATERELAGVDSRGVRKEIEHRQILPGTVFGS